MNGLKSLFVFVVAVFSSLAFVESNANDSEALSDTVEDVENSTKSLYLDMAENVLVSGFDGSEEKYEHTSILQRLQDAAKELISANETKNVKEAPMTECADLDPPIFEEIIAHKEVVNKIIEYVVNGTHKGETYKHVEYFVDTFGPRMSGTYLLEASILYMQKIAREAGFDVKEEKVVVPNWRRRFESATMVTPRTQRLNMLGLGSSVGTDPLGLTARVVAVRSFEELAKVADKVPGKIVVFNPPFKNYGHAVQYRMNGASEAAKYGAAAVLIRSAASFSIGSPHTGQQIYKNESNQIPAACITVEDAQMIYRLYVAGKNITIHLIMNAISLEPATSRNTMIDYKGVTEPEKKVVISGHIDSWDVGVGAMDDAGGCFISYHANLILKKLGFKPRRTIRTLLFTGEEQGIYGGKEYFKQHKNHSEDYQILLESDMGTFSPKGIGFNGSPKASCIMNEILKLTSVLNATAVEKSSDGPDISMWADIGVPIGSLYSDKSKYFWFHHSAGDSILVEDPETLDKITGLWAAVAFVAANITTNLQLV